MQLAIRWLIHWILAACVISSAVVVSSPPSTVQLSTIRFYDQFADEVPDMVYTHGYILIECVISACQPSEPSVELVGPNDEETVVASQACGNQVIFRLDITESIKFGQYRCKYGSQTSGVYRLEYRFCTPLDTEACSLACRDDGAEYCVVGTYDTKPCIVNEEEEFAGISYCHSYSSYLHKKDSQDRVKYCGAEQFTECNVLQPSTLCLAHSKGKLRRIRARVFDPDVTARCFLVSDNSPSAEWQQPYERPLAYPRLDQRKKLKKSLRPSYPAPTLLKPHRPRLFGLDVLHTGGNGFQMIGF